MVELSLPQYLYSVPVLVLVFSELIHEVFGTNDTGNRQYRTALVKIANNWEKTPKYWKETTKKKVDTAKNREETANI